ncbi:mechanosensitive ion channel family protein [Emcibacter nanhaiensis]|uniref:Mechanosensitive ion channel family protein n=1 Tax=Emcibacter nanhaiensis TaxID=1505037 RepID=A0A501PC41_9PROT|nr:mechanosensitive ion channel family protein [Emcibacter nanhaiensis]TPD57567.1 mechanosensitive ion channel family protein [Emcibacter nanhaiensis]
MDKESFNEFINLVVDVWQKGVYGVDVGHIIAALLVLFAALVLRGLFSRFVINRLEALTRRTESDVDDEVIEALDGPLRFIPVVIGVFAATELLDLSGTLAQGALMLNRSLITFNIFWALYMLVTPLSFTIRRLRTIFSISMVEWMVKALKGLIIFLGVAAILETWGIEVAPLIAGLGLFGVAVALGAQDLFKNLIAGLFIIGEQRFHPGDWIKIEGVVEGTVEHIGFRTTMVRQFDKAPVYVPNAKLADSAVINFSRMTHRRIYWKIGLVYGTSVEQLKNVRQQIFDYVTQNEDFASPEEVSTFVNVDSFNDSSIDLMLYCFTRTTNWGEWLKIKEALAFEIKNIVEGNGTSFAFPSQSVYLETLPEGAELFQVPEGQDSPKSPEGSRS